jgi:alkylhydroperoxidase/carboxymuconolactone decarboxylase family protein YurZ
LLFLQNVHGAVAAYHLGGNENLVQQIKPNFEVSAVSDKLKALLAVAGKVQRGGKQVTDGDIERGRQQGASDKEIHDTVLIAAAFCLYSRYVDGLGDLGA